MNSNLSAFRKENVLAIYELIKQSGKLTRTEISKITSISLPTVTKIIDKLTVSIGKFLNSKADKIINELKENGIITTNRYDI